MWPVALLVAALVAPAGALLVTAPAMGLDFGDEPVSSVDPPNAVRPHVVSTPAAEAPALVAGAGGLDVSWEPPAAGDGGVLAACWVVGYSGDGGRTWVTVPHPSTTPAVTLHGLAGEHRYLVRVAARVGGITGLWSPTAAITTGAAAPAAPAAPGALTAVAGDGELRVSWAAPDSDGGAPVSGYVVQHSTDGTTWTPVEHTGIDTAITIGDLTNGIPRLVRVAAVNDVGEGPWTPPVVRVPADGTTAPPPRLRTPTVTAGPEQITVTWAAPTGDTTTGGDADDPAVTGYVVEYSTDMGYTWTPAPHTGTDTETIIGGLIGGRAHQVRVAAANAGGRGASSPAAAATPTSPPPAAPEDLALAAGPGRLTISWAPPADSDGAPLLGYAVEYSTNGIVYQRWPRPDALTTATTATIDGLTGDRPHFVRVGAVSCAGRSPWTSPATATPTVAPPDRPTAPAVEAGTGQLTVTWEAPYHNGAPIGAYVVEYSTDGGNTWTTWPHAGTATTTTITGLAGGHDHQVRISATNNAGTGQPSPQATAQPN